MKLDYEAIDAKNKSAFFDSLFGELAKVPFGTIGKRDMECLLLYLMREHGILAASPNREMANILCLNEKRLKGYLVDMRYKYGKDEKDENVRGIIKDIFITGTAKIVHEKNYYIFAVENPVKKLDFFQAMKDLGFYADTSFSDEIVKVRDVALLAFLYDYAGDKKREKIKEVVKKNKELVRELEKITSPGKPVIEFFKKTIPLAATLLSGINDGSEFLALLQKIAAALFG